MFRLALRSTALRYGSAVAVRQMPAITASTRMFSAAAADEKGGSSFISRFRKRVANSLVDSKKAYVPDADEDYDRRLMVLLLSTPKKEFTMQTLRDFYNQIKVETEAKTDNFMHSRNTQIQQGIDQLKRLVKIFDAFTEDERKYPILIGNAEIERAAASSMQEPRTVESAVKSVRSAQEVHTWICDRQASNLPIPTTSKEIYELLTKEKKQKVQRLQGGYLQRLYLDKNAPRRKRLR